jgi:hypothetical protein
MTDAGKAAARSLLGAREVVSVVGTSAFYRPSRLAAKSATLDRGTRPSHRTRSAGPPSQELD